MYHTFQAITTQPETDGQSGSAQGKSKRISTSNACLECRRRKIRCNGELPCNQCQWYRQPSACKYTKQAQRVVPSRALVNKLKNLNTRNEDLLSRMFPGQTVESLCALSRDELLKRALDTTDGELLPSERPADARLPTPPPSASCCSSDTSFPKPEPLWMPSTDTNEPELISPVSEHWNTPPDPSTPEDQQRRNVLLRLYEASQLFTARDRSQSCCTAAGGVHTPTSSVGTPPPSSGRPGPPRRAQTYSAAPNLLSQRAGANAMGRARSSSGTWFDNALAPSEPTVMGGYMCLPPTSHWQSPSYDQVGQQPLPDFAPLADCVALSDPMMPVSSDFPLWDDGLWVVEGGMMDGIGTLGRGFREMV